jgi:formylglycine-generating enzyme required for sulfatase activity
MSVTLSSLDRQALIERYRQNRRRSAEIFSFVSDEAFYSRPIPLRHPFAFYEGHLPAFSFLTLNERALGEPAIDPHLEKLFQRGIDPGSLTDARQHERNDWPTRAEIAAFGRACDGRVETALASARLEEPSNPRLVRAESAFTIIEHEQMHHETTMYIVHRLDASLKRHVVQAHRDGTPPENEFRTVRSGLATLGADRTRLQFGWDNEFETQSVDVSSFAVQPYPVTNADWLEFVADGGPVPAFWVERDGGWMLRCAFEELPLPRSWPVYVSHANARAYAAWKGLRLPTEPEYHRAAFGTPSGTERPFPWGDALPSPKHHGNFAFQRYDPEPVDAHPPGASAWGIHDLIGNGWEWTDTPFAPLPGFEPMASYPQYSADFFDGKHFVMKGASPVTARGMIRRSFRNWFYDDYPYAYAKFRCVA